MAPIRLVFVVALTFCSFLLVPFSVGQMSAPARGVSPEERQALVALYAATSGSHWEHSSGWMDQPGTECDWYGIVCDSPYHAAKSPAFVVSLELSENNLVGPIPPELQKLQSLEWLSLWGNQLKGKLPEPLIQRWLAGPLSISAEAHLLTGTSRIDYEWYASSILCARRRITLAEDGTVSSFTTKCRNARPKDRATYCEIKQGRIGPAEFARLAWLIEKSGFLTFRSTYDRSVTDGVFQRTRVTVADKTTEVSNYQNAGPLELWTVQQGIEGTASQVDWEKTTRTPACPGW